MIANSEIAAAALIELSRRRLSSSLYEFMKASWHLVEPETPFVGGWHLEAICEHLEATYRGEIRNLVINMPPRHCKSLLCSVFFPVWSWANQPRLKWLCSSYSFGLSVRDSLRARRVVESPWFKLRFPAVELAGDQRQKARFENTAGGHRISTTVLGAATGEGGDFLLVDDPHKVLDAHSKNARESVIDWWNQTMSTRGNDPKTVRKIVVGQRVHYEDLAGTLIDSPHYEKLILPAVYDGQKRSTSIGWSDPRQNSGELLWPERFDGPAIEDLKQSLGSIGFSSQLQQSPAPTDGGMVKKAWFKYYDTAPRFERIVQSWDTAFKGGPGSFVCGQVWGQKANEYYLIDQIRERLSFSETVASIISLSVKYPETTEVLVEDAANGPAIMDTLRESINGLVPIRPDGSKTARLSAVTPLFEAGQVYFPRDAVWLVDYESELIQFPFSANDDQVDATSQALRRLKKAVSVQPLSPFKRLTR